MKFYNREKELEKIQNILNSEYSEFIYIYGRRRIGKTSLIKKSLEGKKFLYFFVNKKPKGELLGDFQRILENAGYKIFGKFQNFEDFLEFIFEQKDLIFVFDEFQNFFYVDKNFYSSLQNFWDDKKDGGNYKFFFIGSMFTMMKKIFEDYKEPLYGRKTGEINLQKFSLNVQKEILEDLKIFSKKNFLLYYAIFGGIPKYLEIISKISDLNENNLFEKIIQEDSFFLTEGKNILIEEFGKNYGIYFSILTAISIGKTKKNEIADYTGISHDSLGSYILKLEKYYELIGRIVPITEKQNSKISRYFIKDLFFRFWFRFILKNFHLVEIEDYEILRRNIKDDLSVFLGLSFESMVKEILIEENLKNNLDFRFEKIGNYFDRKGQNEIDLVCINEKEKKVLFVECKLNKENITKSVKINLKKKGESIKKFEKYKKFYKFYSVEDL